MAKPFWNGCRGLVVFLVCIAGTASVGHADTLTWQTNNDRVTADVHSVPLIRLLEGIAKVTGWHVYVESNITFTASAKFSDLPSGDALRHLLGDLNFALVPQTNASPRFYVFRSSRANATMMVHPGDLDASTRKAKPIPNELVVRLKPGVKVDGVDCLKDAKITGEIGALNVFRVKFENEAATQAARECLSKNPDAQLVDDNYSTDPIAPLLQLANNAGSDINLKIKPQTGDCPLIIGQIDTGMPPMPSNITNFFLGPVSVVNCPQQPTELTHGSAMAETMLRTIQAVTTNATSVKILPVDVYGCNPTTSTFDVAKGIYEALNRGANIINLSLGSSGDSAFLHELIQKAADQGIVFFAAAGNQPVTTPTYPAAYPEVVAVTAGDRNGQIASYANRGDFVDIMTPGTSIVPFDGQSYAVVGTSPATAYASGIAAGLADASGNCPVQVVPTMRSKLGVNFGSAH